MANIGRRRLSTRTLSIVVATFALVAVVMIALLAAVIRSPTFVSAAAQRGRPMPLPSQGPIETALPAKAEAVIEASGGQGLWPARNLRPTPSPLVAKPVISGGEIRPRWTATPMPTNTPTPSPTPNPTFVSSAYGLGNYMPGGIGHKERWIDISLSAQKLVAYEGLVPVFETLVSTGTARYPTVTGQFRIWLRFTAQDMDGYRLGYDYYLKNVPYVQYFYEDYALHGTFWHSNFGTPMSHGCVNLATSDAEWLYNWAGYGTLVNIHP